MYHWDVPLMGWFTSLSGRLPYECLSCGWRGWWLPPELRGSGNRVRVFIAGALGMVRSTATGAAKVTTSISRRVSSRLTGYRSSVGERLARLPRPARSPALGGAALIGVLVGITAALVALSTRAKELPDRQATVTTPSAQTVANTPALEPVVQTAPAGIAPAQPPASRERQRMPQPTPVALTPRGGEATRASASPAPTTGSAQRAIARSDPRPQVAPAVKIAGYRGGLEIDSDPDGARVFVDGEEVGVTPIQLKDLPVGSRVVRVEADGYATWTTAARVVANRRARVSAVLQRSQR
jgi:hypothetical protein